MLRSIQRLLLTLAVAGCASSAWAFSLLGPLDATFETTALAYGLAGDIGGPMNLGEGYRWNYRPITYALDPSFLHYFGPKGSNAVVQAMAVFNNLPPFSKMSANLSEFPLNTTKQNYEATALGVMDIKSIVLSLMLEEVGLTSPERYVWCLRGKTGIPAPTFAYAVIQRNFDPTTYTPSVFVNGVLYTYAIVDPIPLTGGGTAADAIEVPLDPDANAFTAVVSAADLIEGDDSGLELDVFNVGEFFTGLTRDDVGGLRYLYSGAKNNAYVETLPTGATAVASGGSPWSPVPGSSTNTTTGGGTGGGSNTVTGVNSALRPGVDKLQFVQVFFDSTYGAYTTVTNTYIDVYETNGVIAKQSFQRTVTAPDILFTAADLGLNGGGVPVLAVRSSAAAPTFVNNSAINSGIGGNVIPTAGPGQIEPTVTITLSKIGPYIVNENPNFLDQANVESTGITWGSFDATTNPPVLYPQGLTISDLQELIFFGP